MGRAHLFSCRKQMPVYLLFLFQLIVDDDNSKEWTLYDAGPRHIRCPLICFPPASGTADVFFRQLLALSTAGYRVIAVSLFPSCFFVVDN